MARMKYERRLVPYVDLMRYLPSEVVLSYPGGGPHRPGDEPTANSIADLVALVAGVALATALEWYSGWAAQQDWGGTPAPRWHLLLYYLIEVAQKGLVAMIPVVISRRVRYGGPVRPAEFLALSYGLARLLLSFERLPALGLVTPAPGSRVSYQINIERYRLWTLIELVVSGLAFRIASGLRRRLAPWAIGGLLAVAWATLGPAEAFANEGIASVLDRFPLPPWGVLLFDRLLKMPFRVLWLTPLVLAVTGTLRGARPRSTWVERACLGLASAWFLGLKFRDFSQISLVRSDWSLFTWMAIEVFELVASTGLCLFMTWRYGPRIIRWIDLAEPTGTGDSSGRAGEPRRIPSCASPEVDGPAARPVSK